MPGGAQILALLGDLDADSPRPGRLDSRPLLLLLLSLDHRFGDDAESSAASRSLRARPLPLRPSRRSEGPRVRGEMDGGRQAPGLPWLVLAHALFDFAE